MSNCNQNRVLEIKYQIINVKDDYQKKKKNNLKLNPASWMVKTAIILKQFFKKIELKILKIEF